MAFNKAKAQEAALKYLNQGKIAQAIAEYQQVLRSDPKDQAALMTVGDLFVRQGDAKQAIEYFERLAQLFLHDGFNSKAIAIYKKIAKLAPSETQPLERLAELYVQQGVLSEARTLFLQLAEIHLKANQKQAAIGVLQKLLGVEPENRRVQSRLAELYLAMGQKKEAAQTFLGNARRLVDQGQFAEVEKLVNSALEADPGNTNAIMLKAQALAATGKTEAALALAEKLADAEAGGETTTLIVELSLKAGKMAAAAKLARKVFAGAKERHGLAYKVALTMLEGGEADTALGLLGELREAMIESGEQDDLGQALRSAAEQLPARLEPLEWLVDLYRKTTDSFRLPDALLRLADAYAAAGKLDPAESLYQELLERDSDNELLTQKINQVRTKLGREPLDVKVFQETLSEAHAEAAPLPEPLLDEGTQRYVSQALTDVDLFSSYGLSQKAIQLLETVCQRAPRHRPTLERLLDLYLGAGNDRRTAELAAQLEQIYRSLNDPDGAERFAELRQRFQRVAKLSDQDLATAQEIAESVKPAEFAVPSAGIPPTPVAPELAPPLLEVTGSPAQEVDLSDEWAALADEVSEPPTEVAPAEPTPAAEMPAAATPAGPVPEELSEFELELVASAPAAEEKEREAMTEKDFLSELASEVEELELTSASEVKPAVAGTPSTPTPATEPEAESVDQLREVFQDFRAELGEMAEEEEDLETHYNLGIAYREMGLLDEAIGEFQKVAKAVQAGRPFRYAMQCSTLLGLTFVAKGEPKIATMWYQRALETPGLDQESILALRYDLGVAQELAGETPAALDSFRQVYAMNIDYRDVAERIAALQKS
jgi:pilus assembly protein FimV